MQTNTAFQRVLQAIGDAEAANKPLNRNSLAAELGVGPSALNRAIKRARRFGLVLRLNEPNEPLCLLKAGRQFIERDQVPRDVLGMLPGYIDDLNAREAVLAASKMVLDEWREAIENGALIEQAELVAPEAFRMAIDHSVAIRLYEATVALIARLVDNEPAACLAEEIVAVHLIEKATYWLDFTDRVSPSEQEQAVAEVWSIFEAFEDGDVLHLFSMKEPADAALLSDSDVAYGVGMADMRLDHWFDSMWGKPAAGHLNAPPQRKPIDRWFG